jgi:hypothetical protein
MMMSQACIGLVNEAFALKPDQADFEDRGGELLFRLAQETVRGGDPNKKALQDIKGIYTSAGGKAEDFDASWGKCLRAAQEEKRREDLKAEADEMRAARVEFDAKQRAERAAQKRVSSENAGAPKSAFGEALEKRIDEIESPGEHVKKLLAGNRAKSAEEERLAAEQNTERKFQPSFFQEGDWTKAPGVVGELVEWTVASAAFPSRKFSFLSSLATVGVLASHRVMAPTGMGPNQYLLGVGVTGVGKNDLLKAIACALYAIGAKRLVAPRFKSSVALIDKLKTHPVFVARIDEYGDFIAQMAGPKAGTYETGLMSAMKELYTVGYAPYDTPAGKYDASVTVFAPQATMIGFSTEEAFFGAMKAREIGGGFISRQSAVHERELVLLNESAPTVLELPLSLKETLQPLYKPRADLSNLLKTKYSKEDLEALIAMPFTPEIVMTWGPGAKEIFTSFANEMRKESDEFRRSLFARAAEIAVKTATVVAYGRGSNSVDQCDMLLGREFALQSGEIIYAGVLKYMEDTHSFPALCRKIIEMLSEASQKAMSLRDINRKCQGIISRGANIEEALKFLETAERIKIQKLSTGGRPTWLVELIRED